MDGVTPSLFQESARDEGIAFPAKFVSRSGKFSRNLLHNVGCVAWVSVIVVHDRLVLNGDAPKRAEAIVNVAVNTISPVAASRIMTSVW
ncbi:hypothetical protein [Methylobacterium nigriterrae]|uniref:hypothetical protein n=1 Tax=Methylobacterium nigriterrae TaxID=3127512 RepID=UPI00301407C1